jgi:glyoxylase-like metal-dependent hydrolase (beta-lactamase superfamily II)
MISLVLVSKSLVAQTKSDISFSVITTAESSGSLEAMAVDGGSFFKVRKMIHPAVLISHPKGDFLWDSGIGNNIEDQMSVFSWFESLIFSIENLNSARSQLESQQYDFDKLMAIIPSHMHWDHVSGLEDFVGTPVWLQKRSYDEALQGKVPGFIQSQYDSPQINWHFIELDAQPYLGFKKSLDIYGDGSAVLVDLNGHSDGHLGLVITLSNGERYFFIGDTTWSILGIENNKSRPALVKWLFGVDTDFEMNASVIAKIHTLSIKHPGLMIVPAHDEIQAAKLAKYPLFMK